MVDHFINRDRSTSSGPCDRERVEVFGFVGKILLPSSEPLAETFAEESQSQIFFLDFFPTFFPHLQHLASEPVVFTRCAPAIKSTWRYGDQFQPFFVMHVAGGYCQVTGPEQRFGNSRLNEMFWRQLVMRCATVGGAQWQSFFAQILTSRVSGLRKKAARRN